MNNFFARQQQAKTLSSRLLLLFGLAMLLIIVVLSVMAMLVLGSVPRDASGQAMSLLAPQTLAHNAGLLVTTGLGAGTFMGLASLFRIASLRGGGGQVASELGGTRVDPDTRDPLQRRLINVVEEMALASGVAVPEVYVLDQEAGINAFAAGYSPADAAVAVTRGTLERLSRSELQGVIAHEFSHILNGDMRLNIRLIGILFGILVIAMIGRKILHHAHLFSGGNRRNDGAAAVLLIAVGLVALGYIGLFFGRWIKSGIARQREYLADASAVQFTRDPNGIGGALKKIAASSAGSRLDHESEEYSHMLFGAGNSSHLFATHPPILERIRAIEPGFDPRELADLAEKMQRVQQREEARREQRAAQTEEQEKPAGFRFDADSIIENIGHPQWQAILAVAALAESIPEPLLRSARHHEWAPAMVLLMLLDDDDNVREQQLTHLHSLLGDTVRAQCANLLQAHGLIAQSRKLPLLEITLPALKNRSRAEVRQLHHAIRELSLADGEISAFEFALAQIILVYLDDSQSPGKSREHGNKTLAQRKAAVHSSMAALAWFGHAQRRAEAEPACQAGLDAIGFSDTGNIDYWPGGGRQWAADQRRSLQALNELSPTAKEQLVRAWLRVILFDEHAGSSELELLRAYCASIHVPMPPLGACRT